MVACCPTGPVLKAYMRLYLQLNFSALVFSSSEIPSPRGSESIQNASVIVEMYVTAVKGHSVSDINMPGETFVMVRTSTFIPWKVNISFINLTSHRELAARGA